MGVTMPPSPETKWSQLIWTGPSSLVSWSQAEFIGVPPGEGCTLNLAEVDLWSSDSVLSTLDITQILARSARNTVGSTRPQATVGKGWRWGKADRAGQSASWTST